MTNRPIPASKYDPIPAGYQLVTESDIEEGDLLWNDSDGYWEEAGKDEIGDDANAYYGVGRKV